LLWLQQFLRGRILNQISRDEIGSIGEQKRLESSMATANRYLALIRSVLRRACLDWEWIEKAPKVRMYKEPRGRIRWLTPLQAKTLLEELPLHQREVTLFALLTGLRQANVVELTWSHVDLNRHTAWIPGDEAKGRDDIHISLSQLSVDVLRRQLGKHANRVFTYRGKPIEQVNTRAWHKALKRAGIENFRWHDLRHTWASWLVQNGTPLFVVQEMGACKSAQMVQRYAHLAHHANVVGGLLCDTKLAQSKK